MDTKPSNSPSGEKEATTESPAEGGKTSSSAPNGGGQIINQPAGPKLTDFFMTDVVKDLQASFSRAMGISSIITTPAGKPLSVSGDFASLCNSKSCVTDISLAECILRLSNIDTKADLPLITTCSCNNLITGATGIFIKDHHVASWIIGPVRSDSIDEEKLKECAVQNDFDPEKFIEDFRAVRVIGQEQFSDICKTLHLTARMISDMAYTNIRQARTSEKEQTSQSAEKHYREIFENMSGWLFTHDPDGNIIENNLAFADELGYSIDFLNKANLRELIPKRFHSSFDEYIKKITASGSDEGIMRMKAADKSELMLEYKSRLIKNPGGDDYILSQSRHSAQNLKESHQEKEPEKEKKERQDVRDVTIMGLAKLAEYRDDDAGAHLERIREFSRIIAEELSSNEKFSKHVTKKFIDDIYQAAILHDIGKVGIPDAVLLKPGKLDDEEFEIIRDHAAMGGDVIQEMEVKTDGESFLRTAKEIAYYHHEKWNGTGYPEGLKGAKIPLSARIVALADVYDALTSARVYKEAFSHSKAMEIITGDSGKHFDPDVVGAFLRRNKVFEKISLKLKDSII